MISFFKYFSLVIIFIIISNAQVAPYHVPYSIMHSNMQISTSIFEVANENFSLNYIDNAFGTIFPDGMLHRLTLSFDEKQSGHISITDWIGSPS